jgi:hypothetical protein
VPIDLNFTGQAGCDDASCRPMPYRRGDYQRGIAEKNRAASRAGCDRILWDNSLANVPQALPHLILMESLLTRLPLHHPFVRHPLASPICCPAGCLCNTCCVIGLATGSDLAAILLFQWQYGYTKRGVMLAPG